MRIKSIVSTFRPLLAVGCFVMAGLSFSGVVSTENPKEQLLFGFLWMLAGVLWIVRMLLGKRQAGGDK